MTEKYETTIQDTAAEIIDTAETKTKMDRMIIQQGAFTICQAILADQESVISEALAHDSRVHYHKLIIQAHPEVGILKKTPRNEHHIVGIERKQ